MARTVAIDMGRKIAVPFDTDLEAVEYAAKVIAQSYGRPEMNALELREEMVRVDDGSKLVFAPEYGYFQCFSGNPETEVILQEEGEVGVGTGFSSADREAFSFFVPFPPDEFVGNGDPEIYHTVGKPSGQEVKVEQ